MRASGGSEDESRRRRAGGRGISGNDERCGNNLVFCVFYENTDDSILGMRRRDGRLARHARLAGSSRLANSRGGGFD